MAKSAIVSLNIYLNYVVYIYCAFHDLFVGGPGSAAFSTFALGETHQLIICYRPCVQVTSPSYPAVVKMGHAHAGMGKVRK